MSNPLLFASCLLTSEKLIDTSRSKTDYQVFMRKGTLVRKISGNLTQSLVFVHSCSRWYTSSENTVCCLQSNLELHLIPIPVRVYLHIFNYPEMVFVLKRSTWYISLTSINTLSGSVSEAVAIVFYW